MRALLWPVVDLGQWVAAPRVLEKLGEAWTAELLARHQGGDWGDVRAEDKERNEEALEEGRLLLSIYDTPSGRVLIGTEADRSKTTIWFAHE